MSELFVHEFLFRGWPASGPNAASPAWHVLLGREDAPLPGENRPQIRTVCLTPQQAEAAGFSLSAILEGIDAQALLDRDVALAEVAALRAERDALAAQLAEAPTQAPVLPLVSDRQFFQALAMGGDITQAEALAAVMAGTLPGKIEGAIQMLPDDDQFAARMLLSGATAFDRHHPMVAVLGAILDKDDTALDALWEAARAL